MKQTIFLLILALIATSCDRDCEAFDKSREIAKWGFFPELKSEYTFEANGETRVFSKIRSELSPEETIKCFTSCSCIRRFSSMYEDHALNLQSGIVYDQDDEYRPEPISYEIDYFEMEFDVSPAGKIIGVGKDSIPLNPGIKFENLDTLTIGTTLNEKVLHLMLGSGEDVTDVWVARGAGLVSFQADSTIYIRR